MDTDFGLFEYNFLQWLGLILNKLNQFEIVQGVTIIEALFGFLLLSLVISVFWKGGRA